MDSTRDYSFNDPRRFSRSDSQGEKDLQNMMNNQYNRSSPQYPSRDLNFNTVPQLPMRQGSGYSNEASYPSPRMPYSNNMPMRNDMPPFQQPVDFGNQSRMQQDRYYDMPPQMPQNHFNNNSNDNLYLSHNMQNNNYNPNQGMYPPTRYGNVMPVVSRMPMNNQNNVPITGGSNAQGRAINQMLLDILRERVVDPQRLSLAIETFLDRMDCVNLATLLFHAGKKRLPLAPLHIKCIAFRLTTLKEDLRAREASNALYGLKCLSSEIPEVRELVLALAEKISLSPSEFVAQAVGNALYGLQMMTSEYEEVRYLLMVLAAKVSRCTELLEAQNVGNALYGMRGMSSDYKEVRAVISAVAPKIAKAREELNGQALGNSLYGMQSMCSKEPEVRALLTVLAVKVTRTWEELKAQEIGNALYGLKRMSSDFPEVRNLISALVPKIVSSPDLLDAQAIGNSFYGLQNMRSDNTEILSLLGVLAEKVSISNAELDGQAMGNSLYGLQGMDSQYIEVRSAVSAITMKIQLSCLDMNAQELGNALYGLQNMSSHHSEVRRLMLALAQKISSSRHELTSQEIGNAIFGLQGMSSEHMETRSLVSQLAKKVHFSRNALDPQGVANSLFGLQKLSSESGEVRMLINALAVKVEQCWKLLGSHHIANACFGLQNLTSDKVEVRYLLKVLVPKIIACREEMNARQLSHALFGMQSLTGDHLEAMALISALSEKITMSSDPWTGQNLAMALFGLQGFTSDSEEINVLLNAINSKLSPNAMLDMDVYALGNAFFGLQRMKTTSPEVSKLVAMLSSPYYTLIHPSNNVSPSICANIIFGLQGCSVSVEPVLKIVTHLIDIIRDTLEQFRNAFRHKQQAFIHDIFQELLRLYQSSRLSLYSLRDVVEGSDLQQKWDNLLKDLEQSIEDNQEFYLPRNLTQAEMTAAEELNLTLSSEKFTIKAPLLLNGFELTIFVESKNKSALFTPKLNVEIIGSSYSYPSKALFYSLRNSYLENEKGIVVRSLPSESFLFPGQMGLHKHADILNDLYSDGSPFARNPKQSFGLSNEPSLYPEAASYKIDFPQSLDGMDDEMYHGNQNHLNGLNSVDHSQDFRKPLGMSMGWLGNTAVTRSPLLGPSESLDRPPSQHPIAQNGQRLPMGHHSDISNDFYPTENMLASFRPPPIITQEDNGFRSNKSSPHNNNGLYDESMMVSSDTAIQNMLTANSSSFYGNNGLMSMSLHSNSTASISSMLPKDNNRSNHSLHPSMMPKYTYPQSSLQKRSPKSNSAATSTTVTPRHGLEYVQTIDPNDLSKLLLDDHIIKPPQASPSSSDSSKEHTFSYPQFDKDHNKHKDSKLDLSLSNDDDSDMALLQAQMEMAKLEAKIKSLQVKKSTKNPNSDYTSSNEGSQFNSPRIEA